MDFLGVGCLLSNKDKPFDFGADPGHDPDLGFFYGMPMFCKNYATSWRRIAVSECFQFTIGNSSSLRSDGMSTTQDV